MHMLIKVEPKKKTSKDMSMESDYFCFASLFSTKNSCSFQLLSTQKEVTKLQEELETMQPLLAQAAIETQETMEQIAKDSVSFASSFFTMTDAP